MLIFIIFILLEWRLEEGGDMLIQSASVIIIQTFRYAEEETPFLQMAPLQVIGQGYSS